MKNLNFLGLVTILLFFGCNDDSGPSVPTGTPTPIMNYTTETQLSLFCGSSTTDNLISDVYDYNNDGIDDLFLFDPNSVSDEVIACYLSGNTGNRDIYDNDFATSGHIYLAGNSLSSKWAGSGNCNGDYDTYHHLQYFDMCNGPQAWDEQHKTTKLAVGDFDNDGNEDYAFAQNSYYVSSLANLNDTYDNFFVAQTTFDIPNLTNITSSNITTTWTDYAINATADLNNDGFDDLIYSPENVYGDVRIRYGSSAGLGNENQLIPVIATPSQTKKVMSFDFIDLEGDGDYDGVAVFEDHTIGFIENFGDSTTPDFMASNPEPTIHDFDDLYPSVTIQQYTSVGVMDYDLDNKRTDLILTTTNYKVVVFEDQ